LVQGLALVNLVPGMHPAETSRGAEINFLRFESADCSIYDDPEMTTLLANVARVLECWC